MGSYSLSRSETSATDKRQVTSENAIGLSLDGNSNTTNTGYFAPTSQNISGSTLYTSDGGAIKEAFNFANQSLSSVLALAVNRDKVATAAAGAVADTALAGVAAIGQSADGVAVVQDNKILIIGAAIVAAVWFWGKK